MDLEVLVDATLGVIATLMLLPAMIMMGFMTVQLAYDTRSLMIAGSGEHERRDRIFCTVVGVLMTIATIAWVASMAVFFMEIARGRAELPIAIPSWLLLTLYCAGGALSLVVGPVTKSDPSSDSDP